MVKRIALHTVHRTCKVTFPFLLKTKFRYCTTPLGFEQLLAYHISIDRESLPHINQPRKLNNNNTCPDYGSDNILITSIK